MKIQEKTMIFLKRYTLTRYLMNFMFWKQVILISIIFFILISVTFFMLDLYTLHGEEYAVPDFTNKTLQEIKQSEYGKKFRFEVIDSIYSKQVKRGAVVEQNPPPDFKVKINRTIFLTMNAFTPEMVRMPNVVDVSLIQAKSDLQTYGLKINKLKYIASDFKHLILEQLHNGKKIEPGTKIVKGSEIDLVVGYGDDEDLTYIPRLNGLTLKEAKQKLLDAYLNVGIIIYDTRISTRKDSLQAVVFKQLPAAFEESEIPFGESIDIWLTLNRVKALTHEYKDPQFPEDAYPYERDSIDEDAIDEEIMNELDEAKENENNEVDEDIE